MDWVGRTYTGTYSYSDYFNTKVKGFKSEELPTIIHTFIDAYNSGNNKDLVGKLYRRHWNTQRHVAESLGNTVIIHKFLDLKRLLLEEPDPFFYHS